MAKGGCEHHNPELVVEGLNPVKVGVRCNDCRETAWLSAPGGRKA